jgi:arylsulfatase A-like enzyme
MPTNPPNIIVIVCDSLRWDKLHTSPYGAPLSPNLDNFANDAVSFRQAITPANWTLPSHASMFTGLSPMEHGMLRGSRGAMVRLSAAIPTLAETLTDQGYRTLGVTNNPWVGDLSGLGRGFKNYLESTLEKRGRWRIANTPWLISLANAFRPLFSVLQTASQYNPLRAIASSLTTDTILKWMKHPDAKNAEKPFFVFANYMDVHGPYFPTRKNIRDIGSPKVERSTVGINFANFRNVRRKEEYTEGEKRDMHIYYDATLRNFDDEMGRILKYLDDNDLSGNTLVAIISDHGKILGEFPRDDSICFSREIMTRVPILIRYPGLFQGGKETDAEASLLDIYFTLLRLSGAPHQRPEPWHSRSLEDSLADEDSERILFSTVIWPWRQDSEDLHEEFFIARSRRFKLVESGRHGDLFFDLKDDPGETSPLDGHPEYPLFRAALTRWKTAADSTITPEQALEDMPPEVVARLKDLGYM